jgi:hypothetical protein
MPEALDRCVGELMGKGKSKDDAWAICKTNFSTKANQGKEYEEVMKGCREMAEKAFSLPDTFDVADVEIFAAGKWNGDSYTEKDLDEMVRAFNETKDKVKPYLKIGHSESQSLLRSDELPAAGWIANLRRVGRKLVADFSRVPKKIHDLIKTAAYRRVSSEIYWNFTLDGKKYPRMLKAVALLGGETPAVHDLDDIMSLYTLGGDVPMYTTNDEPKKYEVSESDLRHEEDTMAKTVEELTASLSAAEKALADSKAENDGLKKEYARVEGELKKEQDAKAELEKKHSELTKEKKHAEISTKIDKLINEKKIVPAQKEALFTLMSNLPETAEKTYAFGDKKYSTLEEVAMAFVEASQKPLETEGQTGAGEKQNKDLADRAKKYAEDHKVSYKEALIEVSKAEAGK